MNRGWFDCCVWFGIAAIGAGFHATSLGVARADWPGLLGERRDGHASAHSTLGHSAEDVQVAWQLPAGQGYAGASIAGDQVCLFDRQGNEDVIRMVRLKDGELVWRRGLSTEFAGGMDPDKGPRCVPTISGDAILLFTAAGDAHCLERETGQPRWKRSLFSEYRANEGFFGAGSTPLVVGDRMVIGVGGRKAGIICLDIKDGKTVWQATTENVSYASPIVLTGELGGIVVVPTRAIVFGIDLLTGKELWKLPFGTRSQSVVAATPILLGNGSLFLTASYGVGHAVANPSRSGISVLSKGEVLSSQYATPVSLNGFLFGCDGREDIGSASWKCISEQDFSIAWEVNRMPISHCTVVDGKLLFSGIDGSLRAVQPDPSRYAEIWKKSLPPGTYRALPAYEGNTLIVKSDSQWIAVRTGR